MLTSTDIRGIAEYIQQGKAKNIITLCGAGISVSAGIPDFRSPSSGLYDHISEMYPELTNPTDVFNIDYFNRDPKPFFKVINELLSKHNTKPTITHQFIKHLSDKGILLRDYTQNIDALERKAGIPDDKVVYAHGCLSDWVCTRCGDDIKYETIEDIVVSGNIPQCPNCHRIIRPRIVFYGESLTSRFYNNFRDDFKKCDLLIILGTSLAVRPVSLLPYTISTETPVLVINNTPIQFKSRTYKFNPDNGYHVFCQDTCDNGIKKLEEYLGP